MIFNLHQKSKLIACLLLTFSLTTANAQIWKKLKKKVSNKVEEKIDKSADELLDKTLSESDKAKSTQKIHRFDGSATIEISSETGDQASFDILFSNSNEDVICMTMDSGESAQIYNVITSKEIVAYINAGGMKIKKATRADQFSQLDNGDKVPSQEDLKKTGQTKRILGYLCHEYTYKNDGGSLSIWITQDSFPIQSKYAPMLGMTRKNNIKGFVLELNATSQNGEKANVKVVKIDSKKKLIINSSEYKSMF